MSFDFHVNLGESYDGTRQTAAELVERMDRLNIDMALACPFKPLSYNFDQANADLAASIKNYPGRLVGAARVDPWQPSSTEQLTRALVSHGFKAIFLNPWEENFQIDAKCVDPILEIAEKRQVPVIIAAGYPWVSEALQIRDLAKRWQKVKIIMTNGGQINITGLGQADATLAMRQAANLYLDTAGVYREDFIEETVQEFGAERVLFSSNSPYFDQRYEIKRILYANVSENERQAMLTGNAKRLLAMPA